MIHKYTFTTNGSDLTVTTAWQKMTWGSGSEAPTGHTELSPQIARVFATSTTGAGGSEATIGFRWVDPNSTATVFGALDLDVQTPTYRTGLGGATGSYIYAVTDPVTLQNKVDLLGWREKIEASGTEGGSPMDLYVGVQSMTTLTDLTVYIVPTRCV